MSRTITLNLSASLALAVSFALACGTVARASSITTPVNLPNGSFKTSLGGSGSATITGASGNYRTWTGLGNIYINTGVSAANQTVGLNMPTVNVSNTVASGSANIDYDDLTPGTPQNLNSLSADLNGAGGSNQNTNFTINVNPLVIAIGGLGNANLALTVNGMITNALFTSTGGVPANPNYSIPGNLALTVQGSVVGTLVNVLGISGFNISLGTITTLAPTVLNVATNLPGTMLLTDLGVGPFPHTMGVDLSGLTTLPISAPLSLPFSTSQNFVLNNGNHQQGFSTLTINAGSMINANIALGAGTQYDLNGTVPLALVPEPSTFALGIVGLIGLAGLRFRRKR